MSESKLRKHRLKREICLLSIFIAIYPIHYVECRQTLLDLNSLEAYPSLCPPKKQEIRGSACSHACSDGKECIKQVYSMCKVVVLPIKAMPHFKVLVAVVRS